jgi:hypothetical protein
MWGTYPTLMPGPDTLYPGWVRPIVLVGVVFRSLGAGAMGCGTALMHFSPCALNPPILVYFDVGHMPNLNARP